MTTPRSRDVAGEPSLGSPLLDARAAAAHLGVSVAMLRAATAAGEVSHVRLQGRGSGARNAVRWLVADLDEWVLRHRVSAEPVEQRQVAGPGPVRYRPTIPTVPPRAVGSRGRAGPLLSARDALRSGGGSGTV